MTAPTQASFEASLRSCTPVIAIVRGATDDLPGLLDWLVESGIQMVEITTNTPRWQTAVEMAGTRGFTHVGVGTVLSSEHVAQAAAAGATFTVAPGLDADVVSACVDAGLAHLPGVMTPSEIQQALSLGLSMLKLFPAGSLGLGYLRSVLGPFDEVSFIPTGGVTAFSAGEWLDAGAVAVGLGGALTSGDWSTRKEMTDALRALAERRARD